MRPFEGVYLVVAGREQSSRQKRLHYYQELSIAETAEVLGVATSTVKYRLRGALELLRARMADPKRFLS